MNGTPLDELSLDDLRVFVTAIDQGSLNGAARVLALPKSTVSRRLARLESRLESRLVHRAKSGLVSTDAGRLLLEPARRILDELASFGELVRAGAAEPRGRLRISMPQDLAGMTAWIDFAARYPELTLEIEYSNRYVDLIGESFDMALRAGRGEDQRLIVKRVGSYSLYAVASPDYLAAHGRPESREALWDHDCVLLQPLRSGGRRRRKSPRPVRHLVVNDLTTALAGARRGMGVAFLPEHTCRAALEQGELEVALRDWGPHEIPLYAAYPDRRYPTAASTRFIEFVGACFGSG